ncbi:ankyrin repeat domain-containing protein [Parachlamydia sp. AcF125]|uniref:ankyrin repeat domain-containing protein n=1 Tax=Parachlamydia sp. AcF125 TaxID=2795736 RepID=UPI001BC93E88|nr:ankyrin repeat domain-containing protein [Parachlamydia sp. AcF125]MBS4168106.1 hypothetical protein [Parachlamydia sp. AcF125]
MSFMGDYLLAWQLQAEEYKKCSQAKSSSAAPRIEGSSQGRQFKRLSQGKEVTYTFREVRGDRDCFFHAVNRKDLNRGSLIRTLNEKAPNDEVRKAFASEIRQFLYLGCTRGHEDPAEQQAFMSLYQEDFGKLIGQLTKSENQLKPSIIQARALLGEEATKGKGPIELAGLLEKMKPSSLLAQKLRSEHLVMLQADEEIIEYCSQESIYRGYVEHYLNQARGYIPFSRRLKGENFKTTIDVINELFHMNIQVFLQDGSRVTKKRSGPTIPISHNGIDHFSGLKKLAPELDMPSRRGDGGEGIPSLNKKVLVDKPSMPLTVSDVLNRMLSSSKPEDFEMESLLQAGYLGIDYQLLVLLAKIAKLLVQNKPFEATFEEKDHGNLDDIKLVIKDEKGGKCKLQAFQVKYYKKSISADLFVNKENGKTIKKSSKNAKMHIGKFFDGWLNLKKKYSELNDEDRESIIYSNSGLDHILEQCVEEGVFCDKFMNGKKSVKLGGRINKGKDFYVLMREQAWSYLETEKLHLEIVKKRDEALFQQFLRSFRFKVGKKDFVHLIKSIIENLSSLHNANSEKAPPAQLFINLYYAIGEWFRHNHVGSRRTPTLTDEVMISLINDSQIRYHDPVVLQGRSQATLWNISDTCEEKTIKREELDDLERAMCKPGLVMVVGDKGIGKSGLVKQALTNRFSLNYLFLAADALIKDPELKKKVLDVSKLKMLRLIVLDSAEALLSLSSNEVRYVIGSLLESGLTVILTLTPDAYHELAIEPVSHLVPVKPLPLNTLLQAFPKLKPYQEVLPLMELATVPFYLKFILEVISQDPGKFVRLINAKNITLEAQLIKQVVKGRSKEVAKERQIAWKHLAVKLAQSRKPTQVEALKQTSIVVGKDDKYVFSHDLFFEHGLMAFWFDEWKASCIKETTLKFWEKLPNFLKFNSPIAVLAKWFTIHKEKLVPNLLKHAEKLSNTPVFGSIIAMVIAAEDKQLLSKLLKYKNEAPMQNPSGSSTVMLAIFYNSPEALKALFKLGEPAHHRKSRPALLSDSAYYTHHGQDPSYNPEESSSDESSESSIERVTSGDNSDSDSFSYSELEESPIEKFCGHIAKYWSAGFYEEPYYVDDDEGDWITNPRFQPLPHNDSYLHQAVLLNRRECLSILLEQYEEPQMLNLCNEYNETLLHLGILKEAIEVVRLLLAKGALVDRPDNWGETPLHNVAYTGNIQLAELLLQKDAGPNRLNEAGLTPLHIAVARLDLQMVKLFLEHHGDLSIRCFHSAEVGVADILEELPDAQQEEMENFVIGLIELLNFGYNQGMDELNEDSREIVEDLMTLIEHRAQLSEYAPDWDYWDSETELEYAINNVDFEMIEGLASYILDDPDRIEEVLESDAFTHLRKELVDGWMDQLHGTQYQNLLLYVYNSGDPEVLTCIAPINSYILDDPVRIAEVLESEDFIDLREKLVKAWLEEAEEEQYQKLRKYIQDSKDQEMLAWIQEFEEESEV